MDGREKAERVVHVCVPLQLSKRTDLRTRRLRVWGWRFGIRLWFGFRVDG